MTAPTLTGYYANNSSFMGLAIETVRGTAEAAPDVFIPVSSPKITPNITQGVVTDLVGSMAQTLDQIPLIRHDEYTFTCYAYLDTLPALFKGLLGSLATTGSAAPYTHTITLLNGSPSTGNQPPRITFFDWDGYQLRTIAGAQISQIDVKFTATDLVQLTVTAEGLPYTVSGTMPTAVFTTVEAAPSWKCTASLNSTSPAIIDGSLSFKRTIGMPPALGQNTPAAFIVQALDVTGSITVLNANDAEQNLYLNGTAFPISLNFQPPSAPAGQGFAFQMSKVKASAGHQERGSDGAIVTMLDLLPLMNSTDASTGLAQVKVTTLNAVTSY